MQVTVKQIYISSGHNYYGRYGKGSLDYAIVKKEEIEVVAGKGIVGDRFYDYKPNYKGQISFFDWAVYEKVMEELVKGEVEPSLFRRNVMLEGVDVNALIGKRFSLNGVEYTGDGTEEFLKGRGGLRARILTDGVLATGEYELEILGEVEVTDVEVKNAQ